MPDNSCLTALTADLLVDCTDADITGLEERVVLINYADLEPGTGIVYSGGDPTTKIVTNINLQVGTTGYLLEGVRQLNSLLNENVIADDAVDKWRHSFVGQVRNLNTNARIQMDNIAGGRFLAVVEKRWKGTDNLAAFVVLGPQRGLRLTVGVENSSEAEGVYAFTIASEDNALESLGAPNFLDTDYATSLTEFNNLFANP